MQSGLVSLRLQPHRGRRISHGILPGSFILFSFASPVGSASQPWPPSPAPCCSLSPLPYFSVPASAFAWRECAIPSHHLSRWLSRIRSRLLSLEFADTLETTVGYLHQNSRANDSVVIFPYQYMFAVAARAMWLPGLSSPFWRTGVPVAIRHRGHGARPGARRPVFSRRRSQRAQQSHLSLPIDEVSNFTRTPDLWFWIFRHYRGDGEPAPGILALQQDHSRQSRISMQEYPSGTVAARDFPVHEPSTTLDLGAPIRPTGGADFLRLRITVRYSPLWKLRKPERLQLEITLADGSRSVRTFVVEPNVTTDVWFYPWNESDLARYFDVDESRWRAWVPSGSHRSSFADHAAGLVFAEAGSGCDRVR